jgi:hypothetical protein
MGPLYGVTLMQEAAPTIAYSLIAFNRLDFYDHLTKALPVVQLTFSNA